MEMTSTKPMFLTSDWNSETRYGIITWLNYHMYMVLCFKHDSEQIGIIASFLPSKSLQFDLFLQFILLRPDGL